MADSSLGSMPLSPEVERSVTWRGKLRPLRFWQRAWKKGGWIRRLSGVTSPPSTRGPGVEQWISLLVASRASPSHSPGNASAKQTRGGSGHTSFVCSWTPAPASASSRTSRVSARKASKTSSAALPRQGSMRSGVCTERTRSRRRTSETGSSCWPTPTAGDSKASGAAAYSTASGRHSGTTLTDAAVRLWNTPRARDWKAGGKDCLGPQALRTTGQAGMVLNPQFVETLMGLPVGWTSCRVEIASALSATG